jgi:hypothetical protein
MWQLRSRAEGGVRVFVGKNARRAALAQWLDANKSAVQHELGQQLGVARRTDPAEADRLRVLRCVAETPPEDVTTAQLEELYDTTYVNVEENEGERLDYVKPEEDGPPSPTAPSLVAVDGWSSEEEGEGVPSASRVPQPLVSGWQSASIWARGASR